MSATKKLLDKYRKTCVNESDNAIAKSLSLSRPAVSRWVNDQGHPDAKSVEKMANAIGEPVGPWLASIEAERASGANKQVWLRLAATLGTTLALALTVLPAQTRHAAADGITSQTRYLHQWLMAWLKLRQRRSFRHALRGIARPA